jgi:hypothetical protein
MSFLSTSSVPFSYLTPSTGFASINAHPQITLLASLHPIAAPTLPRLTFMELGFTRTMDVFADLLDVGT